jgi:tRNA(Ile2) C34 agmatinyltransferase TiaS
MPKKTLNTIVDSFKTLCCDSETYKKGELDIRCKKCDCDTTNEFYLYVGDLT